MSRWRQAALHVMPRQAEAIREALGIFGFWHAMLRQLSELETAGNDATFHRALAQYCDWYLSRYEKNPYLFTALCYGFAEDLTQEQQALILPHLSPEMKNVVRGCIEAEDENRVRHRHAPLGLHPEYFPAPILPRSRKRRNGSRQRPGELPRVG